MATTTWISTSWAKINLGLNVLRRLPNGYHEICTGFAFLNWGDRIEMTSSDSFNLSFTDPEVPSGDSNLITRAASLFKKYTNSDPGYSMSVEKRIPMGAGLGGGSSNAATAMRMFNKASGVHLSAGELQRMSSTLGADIPVFIHGKTGIGEGIGNQITFADIQPSCWILTVFPSVHVSTAEAFSQCTPQPDPDFTIKRVLMQEPLEEWRYLLNNDLEPWSIQQHPVIGHIKDQMYELGAIYSSMSGSGSSVYGLFEQEFVAVDAYHLFLDWKYKTNLTPPDFIPDFGIYQKS